MGGNGTMSLMERDRKLREFDAIMRKTFGDAWAKEPIEERCPPEDEEIQAGCQGGNQGGGQGGSQGNCRGNCAGGGCETNKAPEGKANVRTNPTRAENELMLNLMVLRNTISRYGPGSKERLKRASPTGWRDLRLLSYLVDKVQEELIETMPERRADYYRACARQYTYTMTAKGPIMTPAMRIVSDKYLSAVLEAAMESECLMCMRTGSEVTGCLIRKCLLEQAPPNKPRGMGCEYREAAGQLIREEEVYV